MAKPLAPTFATVYGSVAETLKQQIGDAQAVQMGPPVAEDIKPAGDDERVKAWNSRNPEATDEAMMAMAQQKYAEHVQSGLPQDKAIKATAEDLTHFRYGQRMPVYTYGQVGYRDQIKEAERVSKLAKRETTPDPEPPPPTMPSGGLTNLEPLGMTPPPASPGTLADPATPLPGPEPMSPMSPSMSSLSPSMSPVSPPGAAPEGIPGSPPAKRVPGRSGYPEPPAY